MSLIAKNEGGDFVIVPAGAKVARCYRIIDLGTQWNERYGKNTKKILISWEFPNELMDDGKPFAISGFYTNSLNEKANLRRDLESWRGRGFTEKEEEGFNIVNVLDKTCYLNVIHNVSGGKTYANISSIMPLPKEMSCPEAINPLVTFDMDNFDEEVFKALPEGIQKMINNSGERQPKEELPPVADYDEGIDSDDLPPF